jgi:hypothetical protein
VDRVAALVREPLSPAALLPVTTVGGVAYVLEAQPNDRSKLEPRDMDA